MKQIITVKTDADTKKAAQELAKDLGLTLNSLINSYLKQVIVTRKIELYAPERMTPKLEKLLEEAEEEIRQGQTFGPFDTVEEMRQCLESQTD